MAWYGIMAGAAIPAIIGALVIRVDRIGTYFSQLVWVVPLVSLLACVVLMRQFFL
jgi:hypothetical protein